MKHGRRGCIAFLDFEKAYDRMDHRWMHRCLEHYEFEMGCRRWIGLIHWHVRASVVQRLPHVVFDVLSSVAQGNPLSPLV